MHRILLCWDFACITVVVARFWWFLFGESIFFGEIVFRWQRSWMAPYGPRKWKSLHACPEKTFILY